MTTAPTPRPEALRLADELMEPTLWPTDIRNLGAAELRRLHAENERLQQLLQCDTPRYCSSAQRCTAGDEHRKELGARKPLPPDALADKCEAWLQAGGAANIVDAFEAGYRAAEET